MVPNRREFLKTAALTGGALGLGLASPLHASPTHEAPVHPLSHAQVSRARVPKRILILGGTGFTGPFQVRYAVQRGHRVTVFNRGRRTADLPPGVEYLQGDRNGQLEALAGREWDVVIDVPATLPRWVRDSAQLLKNSARQYIFVSTISVYADNSRVGMDETTPLVTMPDPANEEPANYGAQKALAEAEAERAFPDRTTVVRPGLIVGPGDGSDRFTYWPVRVARGGEILAPGNGKDYVQIIDARDLAEFIIRLAEDEVIGTFNATGPRSPLTMGEMLAGARAVMSGSHDIRFTWVSNEFLAENRVAPWSQMPVWVPARPNNAGWGRVSIDRALARGLTFRSLADTVEATLAWHATRPPERQSALVSGISAEREAELLAAWHARAGRAGSAP